ncbi:unnamed protein product [Schistocephalus solidus]|uniref:Probable ribosome biogenesis protein RLP24 n=1 Tax=Schistocephalus solidus TaxID=70667 RepID=A0A183SN33_SCHSO|nr:unnamed protein product [Schistocephalus solidus]
MRILRCWFCSGPVYPGHGITFVRNDSKEFVFCRGKCHKAFKHKRAPRKTKWTKTHRKMARKELSDDFAQTFERKRNTALRYSRENLLTTLNAINTVVAIKNKRESLFITKRLKVGVNLRKEEDKKLVKTHMHLIKAPNGNLYFHLYFYPPNSKGQASLGTPEEYLFVSSPKTFVRRSRLTGRRVC